MAKFKEIKLEKKNNFKCYSKEYLTENNFNKSNWQKSIFFEQT